MFISLEDLENVLWDRRTYKLLLYTEHMIKSLYMVDMMKFLYAEGHNGGHGEVVV